jgi:fibronectin-binding autotransporter adhesin
MSLTALNRLSKAVLLLAPVVAFLTAPCLSAEIAKRNNTDKLTLDSSWIGSAPGSSDIALFDSRYAQGGQNLPTGGQVSWKGLRITNPNGGVIINNTNGFSAYLGLGVSGINMSQATRWLTIESLKVEASHTWDIASGETLIVGNTYFNQGSQTVSLANSGRVAFLGSSLTLGNSSGFTGVVGNADRNSTAINAAITLSAGTGASYSIGGTLSTTSTLTKAGAGLYTVNGNNTFASGVRITEGTLSLGSSTAIGTSGSITFLGGALRFTSANRGDYSARYSTANSQAIKLDTNGQSVTHATALQGSGSTLTKLGSGTLTLSATNTYTGGTAVSAGTLKVTGRLGSGSYAGGISNAGALVFEQSSNQTLSGAISGVGSLTKAGSGTLTLTSTSNAWSGGTTVDGGTLITSGAARLPANRSVAVSTGATLKLGGSQTLSSITGTGTVELAAGTLSVGSATGSFAGSLTGGASLTKSGSGTWTLTGASPDYSGAVTVAAGELVLDNDGALNESVDLTLSSGATLTIAAGHTVSVNSFVLAGGTLSGSGTLDAVTTEVTAASIDKPIKNSRGRPSNFVKRGSGVTTVRAANTFTGTLDIREGTVELDAGGSFSQHASLALTSSGTLDLAGKSQTFASIAGEAGTIDLGAGTLTVGDSGSFGGGITGTGQLRKDGTGNLILTGTNSYSGSTTVTDGRLSVNGALQSTDVTVSGGVLGGSGSIGGSITVASGATLAPGNSIESLTAQAASFGAGSTFEYEVDSTDLEDLAVAADLLVVDGDLSIAEGALLNFVDIGNQPGEFAWHTTVFAMINYTGTWDGGAFTLNGSVLEDDSQFFVDDQMWQIDYNATSGGLNYVSDYDTGTSSSFVTVTAVPEPSTTLMLVVAGIAGVVSARFRKTAKTA